jgi:hypothetical protein
LTPESIQLWLQLGLGGLMLAALFLGARKVWVFGWIYAAKSDECETWKALALRGAGLAEKSMTVTESVVKNGTSK